MSRTGSSGSRVCPACSKALAEGALAPAALHGQRAPFLRPPLRCIFVRPRTGDEYQPASGPVLDGTSRRSRRSMGVRIGVAHARPREGSSSRRPCPGSGSRNDRRIDVQVRARRGCDAGELAIVAPARCDIRPTSVSFGGFAVALPLASSCRRVRRVVAANDGESGRTEVGADAAGAALPGTV